MITGFDFTTAIRICAEWEKTTQIAHTHKCQIDSKLNDRNMQIEKRLQKKSQWT